MGIGGEAGAPGFLVDDGDGSLTGRGAIGGVEEAAEDGAAEAFDGKKLQETATPGLLPGSSSPIMAEVGKARAGGEERCGRGERCTR